MFAADVFEQNGKCYVVCSGDGISKEIKPERIMIAEKEYDVKEIHFFESFIGRLQVGFVVEGPKPVPNGEVTLVG